MKTQMIILITVITSLLFTSCSDKYSCQCIENSKLTMNLGTIEGLDIIAANVAFPHNESFRIVADNNSKKWDQITVKLYDDSDIFLETTDGINFLDTNALRIYIDIPISSITDKDDIESREIRYTCNFKLEDNSVELSGSFGLVICEDFKDDFNADDCRWSCQLFDNGFGESTCSQHLCPL